jgi:hypothetical protein
MLCSLKIRNLLILQFVSPTLTAFEEILRATFPPQFLRT